ncbi:hypothetical protein, partial [uncultured Slackia sp.]|uniref:hypothetical protein n=1 Tax=uncultured Slackia sp. TaxID=665903 RepID=UPI00258412E6
PPETLPLEGTYTDNLTDPIQWRLERFLQVKQAIYRSKQTVRWRKIDSQPHERPRIRNFCHIPRLHFTLGTQAKGKPRFRTTVAMHHDAATARLARASSKSHGEVGPSFLTTLPCPNQSRLQKASF